MVKLHFLFLSFIFFPKNQFDVKLYIRFFRDKCKYADLIFWSCDKRYILCKLNTYSPMKFSNIDVYVACIMREVKRRGSKSAFFRTTDENHNGVKKVLEFA